MKKNFRETQNELSEYNKFHSEIIKTHDSEVAKLKQELKKLSKEIMELEVTNGELKEEVFIILIYLFRACLYFITVYFLFSFFYHR